MPPRRRCAQPARYQHRATGACTRWRAVDRHQGGRRALDRDATSSGCRPSALNSPAINGLTVEPRRHACGSARHEGVERAPAPTAAARQVAVARAGRQRPDPARAPARPQRPVLVRHRRGARPRWRCARSSVVPLYSEPANGLVRPSWVGALRGSRRRLVVRQLQQRAVVPAGELAPLRRAVASPGRHPTSIANAHVRGIAPARQRRHVAGRHRWRAGPARSRNRARRSTSTSDVGKGYVLASVFEDRRGIVWVSYQHGLARIAAGHWAAATLASRRPRRCRTGGRRLASPRPRTA